MKLTFALGALEALLAPFFVEPFGLPLPLFAGLSSFLAGDLGSAAFLFSAFFAGSCKHKY